MQMKPVEGQVSLFDLDSPCGRTSWGVCHQTKETTSKPCYKPSAKSGGGKSTDDVPMPKKGRWEHNGCIVGDGYSLAWKILDAQYCGVPQRRKRIYLVADFGSERAGEILLVKSGVSGHFTESGAARERTSADAERSIGRSCGVRCLNPWDVQSKRQHDIDGVYPTLQAYNGGGGRCDGVCYEPSKISLGGKIFFRQDLRAIKARNREVQDSESG